MPRWVISSPIHISSTQPVVRQMTIRKMCGASNVFDDRFAGFGLQRVEQEDVADRLREGQADGEVSACTA